MMPIQYAQLRINKNPDGAAPPGARGGRRRRGHCVFRHRQTDTGSQTFSFRPRLQTINNKMIYVWRRRRRASHHADGKRADKDKRVRAKSPPRLSLSLKVVFLIEGARQAIKIIRLMINKGQLQNISWRIKAKKRFPLFFFETLCGDCDACRAPACLFVVCMSYVVWNSQCQGLARVMPRLIPSSLFDSARISLSHSTSNVH